jgi:hypothetical protein
MMTLLLGPFPADISTRPQVPECDTDPALYR